MTVKHSKLRLGVIGYPISHSRSPLMHSIWLEEEALGDASYKAIEVRPEELVEKLKSLKQKGFIGLNVTIPHKQAVLPLLDDVDEAARRIGAVNTIHFSGGQSLGFNTDAPGFIAALEEGAKDNRTWQEGPALVLGAGGAARAIVHGLASAGVPEIMVANRTLEKAEALKEVVDGIGAELVALPWSAISDALPRAHLLVNTTSLGMEGAPSLEIGVSLLPDHALVSDIVYAPLETDLLRAARARGLTAIDGLGMLIHQARLSFQIWMGRLPEDLETVRHRLEEDLKQ